MTARPQPSSSEPSFRAARILIVDDDPEVRRSVRRVLENAGHRLLEASTLAQAQVALENTPVDLVVLDIGLPDGSGLNFLSDVSRRGSAAGVLMLTGSGERGDVAASLRGGAVSYIHKPVDCVTLEAQVEAAFLRVREARTAAAERFFLQASLNDTRSALDELPRKLAERLCSAWDLRHVETGAHVRRIAHYAEVVGLTLGFTPERAEMLGSVAMLHDLGKIAIPDAILTKPGKLTPAEFETMKLHTVKGAELLSGIRHPFLDLAGMVALRHHERWDGSGYPGGLRGEECPYEARIVGVVDVYDALGQPRCYKPGWSEEAILAYFHEHSGKLFDPVVVAALLDSLGDLRDIAATFPDVVHEAALHPTVTA